jgi:hypothetical protein
MNWESYDKIINFARIGQIISLVNFRKFGKQT